MKNPRYVDGQSQCYINDFTWKCPCGKISWHGMLRPLDVVRCSNCNRAYQVSINYHYQLVWKMRP